MPQGQHRYNRPQTAVVLTRPAPAAIHLIESWAGCITTTGEVDFLPILMEYKQIQRAGENLKANH